MSCSSFIVQFSYLLAHAWQNDADVGAEDAPILRDITGIHDRLRRELERTVRLQCDLPEVCEAEAVTRFMDGDALNIDVERVAPPVPQPKPRL